MVIQYPHTAVVKTSTPSSRGADGNWTEGTEDEILNTNCRAEPSGGFKGTQFIQGADGKKITFTCIVYMPIPAVTILPGMLFEVWDGEVLKVRETVKQYSKGQLNSRVWL